MFKDILDALKAKAAFTALDRLARDFELTPHDSALQRAYGLALFDLGFAERALSALSPLLDSTRLDDPAITLVVGHCHSALGDIQQAATAYRALLNASQPDARSIAYWSLADLKQFRFTDVELTMANNKRDCRIVQTG